MNQPKRNRIPWYSLGLALLLCAAALVTATGSALARYREERDEQLKFQVRPPAQVCMGVMKTVTAEDGTISQVFDAGAELDWKTIIENELCQLDLVITNGVSEALFSLEDQTVTLRLITTAGITEDTVIALRLPPETEGGEETEILAVATPIAEDTSLFAVNGHGWVYTFHQQKEGEEEPGEELTWLLPGGGFSSVSLTLIMRGTLPERTSLLRPQAVAQ